MKGMIYKDFLTIRKTLLLYTAMVLLFGFMDFGSALSFALLYSIMLPINVLAYDEHARFDRYVPMLPVTETVYVLGKYLITWVLVAMVLAFSVVGQLVMGTANLTEMVTALVPVAALGLVVQAIIMPLIFHFGVEKGRKAYVIAIAAVAGLIGALGGMTGEYQAVLMTKDLFSLSLVAFAAAVVISVLSVYVSQKLFIRRMMR